MEESLKKCIGLDKLKEVHPPGNVLKTKSFEPLYDSLGASLLIGNEYNQNTNHFFGVSGLWMGPGRKGAGHGRHRVYKAIKGE